MVDKPDNKSSLIVSFDRTVQIAGFGYDCDNDKDQDCPSLDVVKPKKCNLNEGCLCYFEQDDTSLRDPVDCVNFGKVIFDSQADMKNVISRNFRLVPDENFGARKYFVEKFESNGVITIKFSVR